VLVVVLGALVGGWLLVQELTGLAFDARGMTFRQRRQVLRGRRASALGFGAATYLAFLLPLGAVIMMQFCAADARSSDCRFPDAERFARQAIEAAPEHRDAKNALGVILIHEKRYDEAISVLKPLANDILYATPENAWGNLGWAYLERGNLDEAIDALRRSIAAQPRFCVGNYRLGLAYERKGNLELSREALTKAVDTDMPECKRLQDAFSARARVSAKLGLESEARADLETCRNLSSATPTGQRCARELEAHPSN